MSNKKAYLVLTHTFAPAPGADTSMKNFGDEGQWQICLLYTSPSPRDKRQSRMPSSA